MLDYPTKESFSRLTDEEVEQLFIERTKTSVRYGLVGPQVRRLLTSGALGANDILANAYSADAILRQREASQDAVAWILEQPMLSAKEAAQRANQDWKNPSDALAKMAHQDRVIRLQYGGRYLYPAFQFSEDGIVAQEVNQTLQVNREPWAAASWWFLPNIMLDEFSPVAFLDFSDDLEPLFAAARSEMALINDEL